MEITFLTLLKIVLILVPATWRLSSLIANEMGPFHMFKRLRVRAGKATERSRFWRKFHLYEGVTCEWCNSMWIGTVATVAFLLFGDVFLWLIMPLSLSAGTIIIKHLIELLRNKNREEVRGNVVGNQENRNPMRVGGGRNLD